VLVEVFLESDHTLAHQHDQLQDADVQGNDVVIVPQRVSPARAGRHGKASQASGDLDDLACASGFVLTAGGGDQRGVPSPESSLSSLPG
jgi:hypothetical protein